MRDIVIIGAGPSGVSASLYAKRNNSDVIILYSGTSNIQKASMIDNYYGFPGGISGNDLFDRGIEQAKNLGVDVSNEEVLGIEYCDNYFSIKTTDRVIDTKKVIIATGNKKIRPNIDNIKEFEGKGISYCAICDSFFYKDKKVGILGDSSFAIEEANIISNVTDDVTLYSNGNSLSCEYRVVDKKIKAVEGDNTLTSIVFEDGTSESIDGLFIAMGEAGSVDFAKSLGILMNGDNIVVNDKYETNIPGVYACGNAVGGLLQISKSVYEGAAAGINASKSIRESDEKK